MINLAVAEFLFALIILITAYFISHTINGCIQAYVTSLLGDDTAKDMGYMSPNPFVHIDLFGFLALIFLGIGWLQTVPIDPYAFYGRWRYWKLFSAYLTEAFVSICMAIISLFLVVYLYGSYITQKLLENLFTFYGKAFTLFSSSGAHLHIARDFKMIESPITIVVAFLLAAMVYLNIMIATMSVVFNAFRYMLIVGFHKGYSYVEYADYLAFLGPLLVLYLFGVELFNTLFKITVWGASNIAYLFGSVI